MLCPNETRRGVEIVVENLHKSYVISSYITIYILFWPKISAKTTEILAQNTCKMHKKTHSETHINQNFLGGDLIWFRFVRPSMRACIRPFKNLVRGLKFHIWIPHKK